MGGAMQLERLGAARGALFSLTGPAKHQAAAELCRAEAALASGLFEQAIGLLDTRVAELLALARDRDLFGRRRGLDARQRALLRRLRASRRELRGALRRLRREGGVPFFAFEAHFGDIVARGGFDIVVGNPPWVRGERLAPQVREALTTRYAAWRPASHRGFAHLPDLAVAFVERALELAAPGGVAALLVPAKLASCGYAEPLRQLLAHGTRIERAAPVEGAAAAFGAAAVYPMALVAARAEPAPHDQVAAALGPTSAAPRVPQRLLQSGGPWILSPQASRVAGRLRDRFPALGDRWTPQLGVKTGADHLFLVAAAAPWTRPALRGRDLAPWRVTPRAHVLWTHAADGRPLARLPRELARRLPRRHRRRRRSGTVSPRCLGPPCVGTPGTPGPPGRRRRGSLLSSSRRSGSRSPRCSGPARKHRPQSSRRPARGRCSTWRRWRRRRRRGRGGSRRIRSPPPSGSSPSCSVTAAPSSRMPWAWGSRTSRWRWRWHGESHSRSLCRPSSCPSGAPSWLSVASQRPSSRMTA